MPLFVEVIQTTALPGAGGERPPLRVGANAYQYHADTGILILNPAASAEVPSGDMLIGIATILQTPDQSYENRELLAFPSTQSSPVEFLGFDKHTGTVHFVFDGASHDLAPGETLTLKQSRTGSDAPIVITVLTNHGRLGDIQSVFLDSSLR